MQKGMLYIKDTSGTNINVQIFDTSQVDFSRTDIKADIKFIEEEKPVIIVMDYAFGEQAYETIDELFKTSYCKRKENLFKCRIDFHNG